MKKLVSILTIIEFIIQSFSINTSIAQICVHCPNGATDGTSSNVLGSSCTALGPYSLAAGYKCNTNYALASMAIGGYLRIEGTTSNAIVIGSGFNDSYCLSNGLNNTIMLGNGSTKPTLFIGPSNAVNAPHDKTGKVGIGNVTAPLAKLHIKADAGEAANFLVEPNTWGVGATAMLQVGNQNHGIIGSYTNGLEFKTQRHYIFNDGNVGIGTVTPSYKFQVDLTGSEFYLNNNAITLYLKSAGSYPALQLIDFNRNSWTMQHNFSTNTCEFKYNDDPATLYLKRDGSIGIGTNSTYNYKLAVAGKILTEEVMVQHLDQWYDHVFNEDYLLTGIDELNKYIKANHHLPGIPTTKDVLENGFGLAHMNGLLLQKVEELTLYIIDQEVRIKALEEKLEMNQSQSIKK